MEKPKRPYSRQVLIDELQRVAWLLDKTSVSRSDMGKHGLFDPRPYYRAFGSWTNAHVVAGLVPIPKNNKGWKYKRKQGHGYKREYVNNALKVAVFQRDRHKCVLCGASPAIDENVVLNFDHIRPVALNGKTTYWNLWILCFKCNMKKSTNFSDEMQQFSLHYLTRRLLEMEMRK